MGLLRHTPGGRSSYGMDSTTVGARGHVGLLPDLPQQLSSAVGPATSLLVQARTTPSSVLNGAVAGRRAGGAAAQNPGGQANVVHAAHHGGLTLDRPAGV